MLTMNMTIGAEADVIWIVRIDMDGSYLYFSTEFDKITLSSIDFDGKVILRDGISDMVNGVIDNAINGGTISIVPNFSFSIVRYNDYSGASNFFNDFYPATGKPLLTSKTVDVGIIWRGATTTSEITWLNQYYIQQPTVSHNRIDCFCVGYDELSTTDLPPYTVQDINDNGISYFPNAPDDSMGKPIPIVYGNLALYGFSSSIYRLAPGIKVDKTDANYLFSSHICNAVNPIQIASQYLEDAKVMMSLVGDTTTSTNTRRGSLLSLNTDGSAIKGFLSIQPNKYTVEETYESWSATNKLSDSVGFPGYGPANAYDSDAATYTLMSPDTEMAVMLDYPLSQASLGVLGPADSDCQFRVLYEGDTASDADMRVRYYHPTAGGSPGYSPKVATESGHAESTINYYFGSGNGVDDFSSYQRKYVASVPWTIEELMGVQFHIEVQSGSAGAARIKNCYFYFSNIQVVLTKKQVNTTAYVDYYSKTFYGKAAYQKLENPINTLQTNIFAYIKGYMFDAGQV